MMESKTNTGRPAPRSSPIPQAMAALAGGFILFVILMIGLVVGYDLAYQGRVYPGISVAGIDLSGKSSAEAQELIAAQIVFPEQGKIVFQEGSQVWIAHPVELGLFLDARASALAAYQTGRHGNIFARLGDQFEAWYFGVDLPPLLVYDELSAQNYVRHIATQIDRPTIEASLKIQGIDVVVLPGQIGRSVDVEATLAPLQNQFRSLTDTILPVMVSESSPAILDVSQQAEIARKILSAPLKLSIPDAAEGDPGPWTFEPQQLAEMLTIARVELPEGATYQVGLDTSRLTKMLEEQTPRLARQPQNARFIFNDETRQLEVIQPAVIGRSLDVAAAVHDINQKLVEGEHQIALALQYTQPQVGDAVTAEELGIREQVGVEVSYFYGSSASRIKNIEVASNRFHGLLVPPGAVFSMADALGDVSLDSGYAEALIIYGNQTIKGVGGGVCQVSTTLFRTVFFSGYPIVERHPHAYRVYYYELNAANQVVTRMAGLDATVYVPVVDFKFTNDTDNWLLMETYVNAAARKLTWKFYSTSDGRTVEWDTSGLQNIVEPEEAVYQENPDLDKGEINQIDWAVDGADVTVTRTVLRDGQVYLEDAFHTHYLPWRDVYEYGPGTKIPVE
jgi:vancomycin resistance protein YoaR